MSAPENVGKGVETAESIAMTAPVVMTSPEKIAMTAPVVMEDDEGETMAFLLPSKYKTVEDAPAPKNNAIKLTMMPAGRCEAVIRYSGNARMPVAKTKAEELYKMLDRDGVKATGHYTLQAYNPPFTIPFLKRTEVHIPVDSEPYNGE